jgi:ParB family chromosome partitioning protein
MAKPALGRGLGALMGGNLAGAKPPGHTPAPAPEIAREPAPATPPRGERVERVAISRIHPCPFQPRKDFADEALKELADSIREQGVLQPLIVRARNGGYELIAGERRWRAAQLAGLKELPVLVREADDKQVLELALIENLQRENLNPIEEALGFNKLIQDFALTQEEAAVKVGKSRVTVANVLRLLQLPPEVQNFVRSSLLTFGHARAILGCPGGESQKQIAEQVIREGLSVRETESLVSERSHYHSVRSNGNLATKPASTPDVHISDLQNRLQERFGTKVAVKYRKGKGAVEIRFFNDDDLDRIMEIVGIKMD